ncbi:Serine carboxypeptidase-like 50, partial [Datura stramonium]|nr:Serine carboxypeptidase-like 50 [Datura stramonium]
VLGDEEKRTRYDQGEDIDDMGSGMGGGGFNPFGGGGQQFTFHFEGGFPGGVNSTTGSAIFYTYYEAQKPRTPLSETPILIWLQGGPGCSSMLGNFYELGPWRVSSSHGQNVEHLSLERNPGSWNRIFGLLFLDNPIGTGFSVASSPEEIPTNQHDVAKHLFIATRKFVALDSLFENRPIYLTGESYAGKYVPAFGYYTLKKNKGLPKSRRLNLAGVAIGNGLTDPKLKWALML